MSTFNLQLSKTMKKTITHVKYKVFTLEDYPYLLVNKTWR